MPTYATQLTPFGTAKVKLNVSQQLKGERGEPGIGIFDITYDFLSDYIAVRNGAPIPVQKSPLRQAQIANYEQYMLWYNDFIAMSIEVYYNNAFAIYKINNGKCSGSCLNYYIQILKNLPSQAKSCQKKQTLIFRTKTKPKPTNLLKRFKLV